MFVFEAGGAESGNNLGVAIFFAIEGVRQFKFAAIPKCVVPVIERTAEAHTRIGRDRWDPHALEIRVAQDAPVGDTIQGDTAGDDKVLVFMDAMEFARDVDQRFFGPMLQGPGAVVVMLRQGLARFAARTEDGIKLWLERFDQTVGRVVDIALVDLDAPAGQQMYQILEFLLICRAAHGGQCHDGSLLKEGKSEMLRNTSVEHAERVKHWVRPLALNFVAASKPRARGAIVAITVGHQNGRLLEG